MSHLLTWRRFMNYTAASHHLHLHRENQMQKILDETTRVIFGIWIKFFHLFCRQHRKKTHNHGGVKVVVCSASVVVVVSSCYRAGRKPGVMTSSQLRAKSVYSTSLPCSCYNLCLHPPSSPRRHHHSHPPLLSGVTLPPALSLSLLSLRQNIM